MTKKRTRAPESNRSSRISAAEFKTSCLQLMNRVRETRAEYVITKHGTPVAKLVPCDSPVTSAPSFIGSMKGTVLAFHRPTDPLEDEWDLDRPAGAE